MCFAYSHLVCMAARTCTQIRIVFEGPKQNQTHTQRMLRQFLLMLASFVLFLDTHSIFLSYLLGSHGRARVSCSKAQSKIRLVERSCCQHKEGVVSLGVVSLGCYLWRCYPFGCYLLGWYLLGWYGWYLWGCYSGCDIFGIVGEMYVGKAAGDFETPPVTPTSHRHRLAHWTNERQVYKIRVTNLLPAHTRDL